MIEVVLGRWIQAGGRGKRNALREHSRQFQEKSREVRKKTLRLKGRSVFVSALKFNEKPMESSHLFAPGNQFSRMQVPHGQGGRKKNWYKARCAQILEDKKLFDFLGDVASGEKVERFVSSAGQKVYLIPPRLRERIQAILELRDTAYGKPAQHVDVTNDKALMELLSFVSLLIKQNVPQDCPHCKKDLGVIETLAREFDSLSEKFLLKKGNGEIVDEPVEDEEPIEVLP